MSTATCTPTGTRKCSNHPGVAGSWRCVSCHTVFCGDCVKVREVRGTTFEICKGCGDRCQDIRVEEADEQRKGSFFERLPSAFTYPFQGSGVGLLIVGFIFFGFLKLLSFSMFGKAAGLIGAGYFTAWLFKIASESAMGKEEVSGWPDFTNLQSDIIEPLFWMFLTSAVSFGPGIVCVLLAIFAHPLFFIFAIPLLGVGAFYYPMALLATALQTRLALYPQVILASILKVPGPYVAACAILLLTGAVFGMGGSVLGAVNPILGGVFGFGLSFYLAVVEMRILGLLYYTDKERLGWFD